MPGENGEKCQGIARLELTACSLCLGSLGWKKRGWQNGIFFSSEKFQLFSAEATTLDSHDKFERTLQAQASCHESCGCHSTLIGALQAAPEKSLKGPQTNRSLHGIKDSTMIHCLKSVCMYVYAMKLRQQTAAWKNKTYERTGNRYTNTTMWWRGSSSSSTLHSNVRYSNRSLNLPSNKPTF